MTAHASTFARRDVLDALAKRLPVAASAERTVAELEELADEFLASERAVPVSVDRGLEERRYATPELLALERGLVEQAERRTTVGAVVVAGEHVRAALAERDGLDQDQSAMVLGAAALRPALQVTRQALTPEQVALVAGQVHAGFRPAG